MKIESYIRKIRNRLDVEKPDEDYIWTGISQSLNKKRRKSVSLVWKIAAAILLLFAISYLFKGESFFNKKQQSVFATIDPELAEQEKQILNQINLYYKELKKAKYKKSQIPTQFDDLEYIDRLIKSYSDDLIQYGPNPKILNTLMDLYQKKIKVLDRMLNEIEKNKQYEDDKLNI